MEHFCYLEIPFLIQYLLHTEIGMKSLEIFGRNMRSGFNLRYSYIRTLLRLVQGEFCQLFVYVQSNRGNKAKFDCIALKQIAPNIFHHRLLHLTWNKSEKNYQKL